MTTHKRLAVVSLTALALATAWIGVSLRVGVQSAAAQQSAAAIELVEPVPNNIWVREPILVFDVTGSTLAGQFHDRLSVYNDGLATVSRASDSPFFPADDAADFTFVTPARAAQLRAELAAAGAGTLLDSTLVVSDVPLNTVTFFPKPGPRSRANTFSWWLATGAHGAVSQAIQDFTDEVFPGF